MEKIPANASDVKLHKIKQRLAESLLGGRYRVEYPGYPGEEFRELEERPEADITRPQYRALCDDCGWTDKSKSAPHDPGDARISAHGHAKAKRHRTRTVFDIVGQLDETFSPGKDER